MRLVIQRVKQAQVKVDHKKVGEINKGILVFLGIEKGDSCGDVDYLVNKITQLRIFSDPNGKMNLSAVDVQGDFLVVSQFTLIGDCSKGRRPSFDKAADLRQGEDLYNLFIEKVKAQNFKVETGQFRAMMDVHLVNDGPVTFILESRIRD